METWSQHGRHGLAVVVAAPEDLSAALSALHPAERDLATSLSAVRQREWVAGRSALRSALRLQGLLDEAPLLRDDRGAPLVPPTALGSISHKAAWAAALAAPRREDRAIGVDLEQARPPRVDLSARILTEREAAQLTHLEAVERGLAVTLRFSIKEAVYKAIDPWVRRYVGFREVELEVHDDGTVGVHAVDPRLAAFAIEATWTRHREFWLCTAQATR